MEINKNEEMFVVYQSDEEFHQNLCLTRTESEAKRIADLENNDKTNYTYYSYDKLNIFTYDKYKKDIEDSKKEEEKKLLTELEKKLLKELEEKNKEIENLCQRIDSDTKLLLELQNKNKLKNDENRDIFNIVMKELLKNGTFCPLCQSNVYEDTYIDQSSGADEYYCDKCYEEYNYKFFKNKLEKIEMPYASNFIYDYFKK
jgi:hypothetical protein